MKMFFVWVAFWVGTEVGKIENAFANVGPRVFFSVFLSLKQDG